MSSRQIDELKDKLDNATKNIQSKTKKSISTTKSKVTKTVKQVPKEISKLDKLAQVMIDYRYIPLVGFTLLYVASPIDIIPELWVGEIGYLEDVIIFVATIAFIIYTKKKGVTLHDNQSRYSKDKTNEELYAFIVRNDSEPVCDNNVPKQDPPITDNINSVSNLLGGLNLDDMSESSGETNDIKPEKPNSESETKSESVQRTVSAKSSEPKSCFDHSSTTVRGIYETRECFSTPNQPDTQRVESDTLIW